MAKVERVPLPAVPIAPGVFAATLERTRLALGFKNKKVFAAHLGMEPNQLSKWRRIKTLPRPETLLWLAVKLGRLVDELLVGVNAEYDAMRRQRLAELVGADTSAIAITDALPAPTPPAAERSTVRPETAGADIVEVLWRLLAVRRETMTDPTARERLLGLVIGLAEEDLPRAIGALSTIIGDAVTREQRRGLHPPGAAEGGSG